MATDKPRFTITVSDDTLKEIVNFQHDRNLATRSNAIQQLIQIGIDDLKNHVSEIPLAGDIDHVVFPGFPRCTPAADRRPVAQVRRCYRCHIAAITAAKPLRPA